MRGRDDPRDWTLERLLVVKMLVVPLGAALVAIAGLTGQDSVLVLVLALASVIGYFLPDLLLLSRGQERDQRIQLELADTLDQMTIAVEAGLAFDAAMSRAAANGKGALAEEFTRTLQDIRMGVSRAQAFKELGERNEVPDLRQFVRAILQADAFGISIGDVLRTQAAEMRLKRRQRAEEKAQQVPVKVVFPLIVCILPALFIVIMGPAVINIHVGVQQRLSDAPQRSWENRRDAHRPRHVLHVARGRYRLHAVGAASRRVRIR